MKKLLVYGGAFNPPHLGHEKLLAAAMGVIEPDIVLVTPSEVSPHKDSETVPFFDRAYMSRTFLGLGENVKISGIENTGKRRKSYTINTIKRLKKKYKDYEIYLLIGSDMLVTFSEWYLYRRLCSMVTLVAAGRQSTDGKKMEQTKKEIERMGGRVVLLDFEPLEVSSTEIRSIFKNSNNAKGLISGFVARYVNERRLYR
jgi:nicotinate (nicotinamide) nucleotide adenylyltransferase